ncbi:MAG: hypothetical protein WAT39_12880 [Planctomycetota bacterium]
MIDPLLGLKLEGLRRWTAEPQLFVREVFGAEPHSWQDRELIALPEHNRVAIAGSKGCAKTCLEAWIIWWSMATQKDLKGVCTSITGPNLKDGLWAELAKWLGKSPLLQRLFSWSSQRITRISSPETWFTSARTWSQSADANTQAQALAGIHGDNVLFVIDEAGGVPPVLLATADAALANQQEGHNARVLIAGNTTSPKGALYQAVTKQRTKWRCVRVTSDPDDPDRTPAVSIEWAREQIAMHGRDNPWVQINVFAEFPQSAMGRLLSLADLEASAARVVDDDPSLPVVIGVDVGMVQDAAVLYPRRGRLLMEPKVMRGKNSIVIAAELVRLAGDLDAAAVFIDAGGPGLGVIDQARALGLQVVPVYFGGDADDRGRYANKRIEMYVRGATWIKEGGAIGADCPELVQDLEAPEVGWNEKGQQLLEPKKLVAERLGRSPDWGDGFALTFAYPVSSGAKREDDATPQQMGSRLLRGGEPTGWDEFGHGG